MATITVIAVVVTDGYKRVMFVMENEWSEMNMGEQFVRHAINLLRGNVRNVVAKEPGMVVHLVQRFALSAGAQGNDAACLTPASLPMPQWR